MTETNATPLTDHEEIFLGCAKCADPSTGRLWAHDDPHECFCDDGPHDSTRYVRADLHDALKAELAAVTKERDALAMYFAGVENEGNITAGGLVAVFADKKGGYTKKTDLGLRLFDLGHALNEREKGG